MKIPLTPPATGPQAFQDFDPMRLFKAIDLAGGPTQEGKYRHWDTLRHLQPPEDLTSNEWWFGIKSARRQLYKSLPLKDKTGSAFVYATTVPGLEMLHRVDRDASGAIQSAEQVTDPDTRNTYLIRSLVEEAITSSQLEGASTTRKVAKEMIREGREPRTRSERMILNNYRGMEFIRRFLGQPLTPSIILELQTILVEGTLDDPDAAGRYRRDDEGIAVTDEVGNVLHAPPPAAEIPERIDRLCKFANASLTEKQRSGSFVSPDWIHPVVRAILVHFMIGYDHPFVDGNGRTARALFYWSMASQGYWLAEFVSISRILKRARTPYARAFLYTETDENDTTYFILYQLRVFIRAIVDLHVYLARKAEEIRQVERAVQEATKLREKLNERQLTLMAHALKHPEAIFTIDSHRRSHGVSYETARTDLRNLAHLKFLTERRGNRAFEYVPAEDLTNKIGKGASRLLGSERQSAHAGRSRKA
jgi:Fic family protein